MSAPTRTEREQEAGRLMAARRGGGADLVGSQPLRSISAPDTRPTPVTTETATQPAGASMSGAAPQPPSGRNITINEIRTFRQKAMANGYHLVRVKSGSKAPLPHDWQHGDRPEALLEVRPDAPNTGLVARFNQFERIW
jgi:hypothetical protein